MPRQRTHTLYFLRELRTFSPVFLDTEIDARAVLAHRQAARADGARYSLVAYVLYAAGRALARHPEANAAVRGRRRLKLVRYPRVDGKLTLDRTMRGQRVVLSTVLAGIDTLGLEEIQARIDAVRDGDPDTMPEFAAVRMLHKLPGWLAASVYRLGVRPLGRRPAVFGTVAVTSLGHRPVDAFHSVGGTTVTLGVGRVADRPVAVAGRVAVAPVMRLSLAFDHRVIDGAEAADVLADIKQNLEEFAAPAPVAGAGGPAAEARRAAEAGQSAPAGLDGWGAKQ